MPREDRHPAFDGDQAVVFFLFLQSFGLTASDYRLDAEKDGAMVRVPPQIRHPALELGIVAGGLFNPGVDGEHSVGVFSREFDPAGRGPCLDQRWAVLRRADDIQRSARAVVAAYVFDAADLRSIGEDRVFSVHHHGIFVPAIP